MIPGLCEVVSVALAEVKPCSLEKVDAVTNESLEFVGQFFSDILKEQYTDIDWRVALRPCLALANARADLVSIITIANRLANETQVDEQLI